MSAYAAVDCGTNSIRLLIRDGKERLREYSRVTRLGRGVHTSRVISEESIAATLEVLDDYRQEIESVGVVGVRAVATSAVRDAANGDAFVERASTVLGTPIELISGQNEAELTFAGAMDGTRFGGKCLVVDIGGGSTEFALGESSKVDVAHSFDMGCVRMTELYLAHDPPDLEELERLMAHLSKMISATDFSRRMRLTKASLMAVGGTATAVASIDLGLPVFHFEKVHGHVLDRRVVRRTLQGLIAQTSAQRSVSTGLPEGRADVIVAGTAILLRVMEALGQEKCIVSATDILDGLTAFDRR